MKAIFVIPVKAWRHVSMIIYTIIKWTSIQDNLCMTIPKIWLWKSRTWRKMESLPDKTRLVSWGADSVTRTLTSQYPQLWVKFNNNKFYNNRIISIKFKKSQLEILWKFNNHLKRKERWDTEWQATIFLINMCLGIITIISRTCSADLKEAIRLP